MNLSFLAAVLDMSEQYQHLCLFNKRVYLPSQSIFPAATEPTGDTALIFVSGVNLRPSLAAAVFIGTLRHLRISRAGQDRCVE